MISISSQRLCAIPTEGGPGPSNVRRLRLGPARGQRNHAPEVTAIRGTKATAGSGAGAPQPA